MKLLPSLFSLALAASPALAQGPTPDGFIPLSSYGVPNGSAEIVAVSEDGMILAYSDFAQGAVGFVDITNPAAPALLAEVFLPGQPTSVAIAGNYAIAAVQFELPEEGELPPAFLPGRLYVINILNPAVPVVAGYADIGWQPDSVKLTVVNGAIVAVVAIENQPVVLDGNGLVMDEEGPGSPTDASPAGLIQVIQVNVNFPPSSIVVNLNLPQADLAAAGLLYPTDPQPEFVDIFGSTVAVTLQENNGVALVDIKDPNNPVLTRVFSSGIASSRYTDLDEDEAIDLNDLYPDTVGIFYDRPKDAAGTELSGGLRMSDAIAFSADGSVLYTADEGELNFTGGRGFSAWDLNGNPVWDDAGKAERYAVRMGQYPDARSANKGIEMEGVEVATFGAKDFAFVLSERGSFMLVVDVTAPAAPKILQLLPTGSSPEGVVAIPARGLVVTADEVSNTLSIFSAYVGPSPVSPAQPVLYSASPSEPWSAFSGFAARPGGQELLAVPDNALPTALYRIKIGGQFAQVVKAADVTVNGVQARYDCEGVALDRSILAPANPGGWLASEGNGSSIPNLLVQVDGSGAVLREIQLPFGVDAAADPNLPGNAQGGAGGQKIRSNGFEGMCLSDDGRYLLAAIQRDFANEFGSPKYTRIARYDLDQLVQNPGLQVGLRAGGDWEFFFYELDSADTANWDGLSEIVNLGGDRFALIERDKGIGTGSTLKKIYEVSLAGLVGDTDGIPDASDTVGKTLLADVLAQFFPYEKIESLAVTPQGDLWIGMDNDGGTVENRVVNLGPIF